MRAVPARLRVAAVCATALLTCVSCAGMPAQRERDTQVADPTHCAARGGQMVALLFGSACDLPFADAGTACTDSAQCRGRCLAAPATAPTADVAATGACRRSSVLSGCFVEVRAGRATAQVCID